MTEIERFVQAEQMLAEIANAKDAKQVMDLAEAARVYAKKVKLGTKMINHATRIKLRAELRLAELVTEGQAKGEIAKREGNNSFSPNSGLKKSQTLADMGISKQRLSDARKIAREISADEIDEMADKATKNGKELTRQKVMNEAESRERERRYQAFYAENKEGLDQIQEQIDRGPIRLPFEWDMDLRFWSTSLLKDAKKFKELWERGEPDQRKQLLEVAQAVFEKYYYPIFAEDVIDNAK